MSLESTFHGQKINTPSDFIVAAAKSITDLKESDRSLRERNRKLHAKLVVAQAELRKLKRDFRSIEKQAGMLTGHDENLLFDHDATLLFQRKSREGRKVVVRAHGRVLARADGGEDEPLFLKALQAFRKKVRSAERR